MVRKINKYAFNFANENRKYRNDIEGLRSIALLAVILFHYGHLPQGFLGVDIFLVISGFLITGITYVEVKKNRFSLKEFYLRRIRRIVPLTLFVGLIALIIGIATMLPDDLENLSQSVIATNIFSNNILLLITTGNYWDVTNEYKPLMHTWYLGVQEQCYLLYPILFAFVGKKRITWILPVLSILTIISLILYLLPFYSNDQKFYLLFFRFWEIGLGGIAAIIFKNRRIEHKYSMLVIFALVLMLCIDFAFISCELTLIIISLLTLVILVTLNQGNNLLSNILDNKLLVALGNISFSMYMWHQVLVAYARYFWIQSPHITHLTILFVLTVILAVMSYFLIEKPFRSKARINTKKLLLILVGTFFISSASSFFIYINAGVLKDITELGIRKADIETNLHAKYNDRIYDYDKNFVSKDKLKVLVIGTSYARDWANVLLESEYAGDLEISYIAHSNNHKEFKRRVKEADIVFYSDGPYKKADINTLLSNKFRETGIPEDKLWVVGTKNFGSSNGIFYNYKGDNFYQQRAQLGESSLIRNNILRLEWGDRYIDYVAKVIDKKDQTVPVFTPNNQFISQDCWHFTKAGARYFAQLFKNELALIFSKVKK